MLSSITLSSCPLKESLKLVSFRALGLPNQGKIHINIFFTAEKKAHQNGLQVNFAKTNKKNPPEELKIKQQLK